MIFPGVTGKPSGVVSLIFVELLHRYHSFEVSFSNLAVRLKLELEVTYASMCSDCSLAEIKNCALKIQDKILNPKHVLLRNFLSIVRIGWGTQLSPPCQNIALLST